MPRLSMPYHNPGLEAVKMRPRRQDPASKLRDWGRTEKKQTGPLLCGPGRLADSLQELVELTGIEPVTS